MTSRLAVTVTGKQPGRYLEAARTQAAAWGLPFLARGGALPFDRAEALLVLGAEGWTLRCAQGALGFSPGLAAVRIKRLRAAQQQEDHLVQLAELQPGDSVIDATFGLGVDALVCAHAVGPRGRVLGIEASLPLFALASAGLRRARAGSRTAELLDDAAPIELRHGAAREVLAKLPAASVDCVFFDPMFDRPRAAAPAFEVLRRFAVETPLDAGALAEARRVARRWVVVKAGRYGKELERLGLAPVRLGRYAPTVWGRVSGD
jgi:16S rRNA (guanine1516-N2)-methyltransferase